MKRSFQISLLAAGVAAIGCRSVSGATEQGSLGETLCIHLYDFAHVAPQRLKRAMAQTTRVLATAGISTTWEEPSTDSPEAHTLDLNGTDGRLSSSAERPWIVLRIMPDVPFNAYVGALGFAVPYARFGFDVEIIYHRVENEAELIGVGPDTLLAYTMAHEIGHVLLRSSAHSVAGVMQARSHASLGIIEFLPEQAKQMCQELSRCKIREQGLSITRGMTQGDLIYTKLSPPPSSKPPPSPKSPPESP